MKPLWCALLLSLGIVAASTALAQAPASTIHVSPLGSDTNEGTVELPFLTIDRALKASRKVTDGPRTIVLAGGDYELAAPILLDESDSGLTLSAARSARLLGGRVLGGFSVLDDEEILAELPESARGKVLEADLGDRGITEFGKHKPLGMKLRGTSALELFVDGQRQTLARYPNRGWLTISAVPDGKSGRTLTVGLPAERLTRWGSEADAWLYGYWFHGWADSFLPVAQVDAAGLKLTLGETHHYGLKPGQRFFARNLLCELDSPGEYYIDAKLGQVYFYPVTGRPDEAIVSVLEAPIIQVSGAADVLIEGLTIEAGRSSGIQVRDSTSIRIVDCTIRNLGDTGVDISGGKGCRVTGCEISHTGSSGILLRGGDRRTLTPADHRASGNHLHHSSRLRRTYTPAIALGGVGNRADGNLIHHAPHQAISFTGNDHVIERNEIHHVVLETDDAGAIYTCPRDFTSRGTTIRHNHLHHCGTHHAPKVPETERTEPGVVYEPLRRHGTSLIYLDDLAGGILVEGNILEDAHRAFLIGGGRDNLIRGNLVIGGNIGIWIDGRGLGWAAKNAAKGGPWGLYRKFAELKGDRPPFVSRYPGLKTVLTDHPAAPVNTVATGNIVLGAKRWQATDGNSDPFVSFEGNHHGPMPDLPAGATPLQILETVDQGLRERLGFGESPFEDDR